MPVDFLPVFENKVKFNHDKKLPRKFRIILVGASVSGISFLFSQMLLQKGFFSTTINYIIILKHTKINQK